MKNSDTLKQYEAAKAKRKELESDLAVAVSEERELRDAIAADLCPFKIGQHFLDKNGVRFKVLAVTGRDWGHGRGPEVDAVRGLQILKNGSEGKNVRDFHPTWDKLFPEKQADPGE